MFIDTILKLLPWVIVLYVVMCFIGSLRRLTSILSLLSAIALLITILSLSGESDYIDYMHLPILFTLMSMMFYLGEGYMNPNVVENAYDIVAVERKWESIFEEDDTYVLHLSPKSIGGYLENTVFGTLIWGIFYGLFMTSSSSWIVFLPAIYLIGMSIVLNLVSLGFTVGFFEEFPSGLYWIARFVVIIVTIAIATSSCSTNLQKYPNSSSGCGNSPDYETLAQQGYEYNRLSNNIEHATNRGTYAVMYDYGTRENPERIYFFYAYNKGLSGTYVEENGELRILDLYAYDPRIKRNAKFKNVGGVQPKFILESFEESPFGKDPYKYIGDENLKEFCSFTPDIFKQSTKSIYEDKNLGRLRYKGKYEDAGCNSPKYYLDYWFDLYEGGLAYYKHLEYIEYQGKKEWIKFRFKVIEWPDPEEKLIESLKILENDMYILKDYTPTKEDYLLAQS